VEVSGTNSWGRTVFELCRDYENVYCEFGCQDAIADPAKRHAFSIQLATLIDESQQNGSYDFSTKILYGTDWFMPMSHSSDRLNHLLAHQTAIYNAGVANAGNPATLFKNYFYRNALRFLNAEQRIKKPGLPSSLRSNINQLLPP
jgi:N-acyl-D-aspartate/D-glutamate deacylase